MSKVAVFRRDYQPSLWQIPHIDLRIELDPLETIVTSTLHVKCMKPSSQPVLQLDGDGLELLSVAVNGVPLASETYTVTSSLLSIPYQGASFVLTTKVRISPKKNTQLEGLYVCGKSLTTQCEAQGFRRITWMLDRPDIMSTFDTTLIADANAFPVLLSNGNPISDTVIDGYHQVIWRDPFPKPCYLFACVAGDLSVMESQFLTMNGRNVRLAIYAEPHHLDRLQHAMDSLKRAMRWDEDVYGLEYDLDHYLIYCADDFNMGAMENKGLNVFNTKCVLASPDTATDDDYINVERVIAHEYFHNWTGNRVTCRDWFQLSFKEGWTVYREAGFAEDMGDAGLVRLQDVDFLRVHQFPEDAGPHAHPIQPDQYVEIDNFYTTTIYEKGAEVIRMLAMLMGENAYRAACNDFFKTFDGQAVTCQDFLGVMRKHTTLDMNIFERWYHQAGTPVLEVHSEWNKEDQTYRLFFKQETQPTLGQPDKKPVMIPIKMGLLGQSGQNMPIYTAPDAESIDECCIVLKEEQDQLTLYRVTEAPVPVFLRGFSAPVQLKTNFSIENWLHIVRYEKDACVRDGALNTVIQQCVKARMDGFDHALFSPIEDQWLTIVGEWLEPERALQEPGVIAHLLTLPSVSTLAEAFDVIQPSRLVEVRLKLERRVLAAYREKLEKLYACVQGYISELSMVPYDFSARATGLRALRSRVLSYLTCGADVSGLKLAQQQYEQARCLTDRVGALAALNRTHSLYRSNCLNHFHDFYKNEALVLDKAWALESTCPDEQTFQRIQSIWSSSSFDKRNPNRVRSLLYTFGHQNWSVFHSPTSYRFMADVLRELDQSNPNLAARLVTVFSRWSRFEASLNVVQKQVLESLQSQVHSANVKELLSKYLSVEHA